MNVSTNCRNSFAISRKDERVKLLRYFFVFSDRSKEAEMERNQENRMLEKKKYQNYRIKYTILVLE